MSIVRKRNASQKVYIPNNARDNQYILAEFPFTQTLIDQLSAKQSSNQTTNLASCYQTLSDQLIALSQEFSIDSCILIANDKLVRVRYSQEMHQWQTKQQIIFYYDPEKHQLKNAFFDANQQAKKISLLFLATGDDLRANAANFHQRTRKLLRAFARHFHLAETDIRFRDHQHLTFDIFAKDKGNISSKAHKLRPIARRYSSQQVSTPGNMTSMTYAIINLPLSHQISRLVEIDLSSPDPYNPLYTYLTDTFSLIAKQFNLNNGALIANGLVPIVRYSLHEIVSKTGELQMLGYNPIQSPCGIISKWQADELVDNVQLIFVATYKDNEEQHHAKFVNQIIQAMQLFATELELSPATEQLFLRFHQHVAYNLHSHCEID